MFALDCDFLRAWITLHEVHDELRFEFFGERGHALSLRLGFRGRHGGFGLSFHYFDKFLNVSYLLIGERTQERCAATRCSKSYQRGSHTPLQRMDGTTHRIWLRKATKITYCGAIGGTLSDLFDFNFERCKITPKNPIFQIYFRKNQRLMLRSGLFHIAKLM